MYDATKIIIGLAIFLGLVTLPFWLSLGGSDPLPEPVIMDGPTECVESAEYMRANHMKLLDQWRDEVVRDGNRTYVSSSGKIFEKSLTKTCLDCHANKEQFCEQCHKQVAVEPYCWQCHVVPNTRTASGLPQLDPLDQFTTAPPSMLAGVFDDTSPSTSTSTNAVSAISSGAMPLPLTPTPKPHPLPR